MTSTRNPGDTMRADLEAVRGYDPDYDADAGGTRFAAALAVGSGAALSGVLPHAVSKTILSSAVVPQATSVGWWAMIKASTWGPVALVVAVGAGGAAATVVTSHGESGPSRRVDSVVEGVKNRAELATSTAARAEIGAELSKGGEPSRPPAASTAVEVERAVALPPRSPARPGPKQAERGRSIRDEVREVATLRKLLTTDPEEVLVGIDGRRANAGGTLDEERAMLAVEALVALDRPAEARERARAFLLAYPASAYAARARLLVQNRAP